MLIRVLPEEPFFSSSSTGHFFQLGHVACSDRSPTGRRCAKIARVRELIAARTLCGICCTYTSPVVLMLAWRKTPCASLMVPCCCRSVPQVAPHHLKRDQPAWDVHFLGDGVNPPLQKAL